MVAKKILRVSPAADDIALRILSSVCKYSPKSDVLPEMLSVGAVAKLCLVLQADCASGVKEKARGPARTPSDHRDDAGLELGDLEEGRLVEVEVPQWRIAPVAVVVGPVGGGQRLVPVTDPGRYHRELLHRIS
ncbi:hypothetical protein Taro_046082 [Colocasia esculenta]|uniref:U-box domain-containing protein n=1 Tax=Colocasia esculenta TaxID=4460 RepID=A0A843X735_COLES|nr:hypothetical protein [Colocasia esculenta]